MSEQDDRRAYIERLEASITEHEHIIGSIHEKIAHLYEAERQDNIALFIERTGLTISDGDELNVTPQFDDYVSVFLVKEKRVEDLKRWIQRKEGALTIYNYELDESLNAVIDAKWTEVEYRRMDGHYFQDGMARIPVHSIHFRNVPIDIIKLCMEDES